jgi:hypothetical protein
VPGAPDIFRGCLASLHLALTQRQLVSSAEVPILPPYMHPEMPHDVLCPLETPATHMAPLETWEVVEEVKGNTFSRSSQYLPACRSSFRGVSPLSVPFSTQSKGVLPAFPDLVPLMHPPPCPLPEAGHTSYICLFIGVSPLTPPSAGSLLTGPGVTIPGFLD